MPRNNPEQRKNRMQAALQRALECLADAQVTSSAETFLTRTHEDLRRLEEQLARRDALDPQVTVVAVAGPSGTGKSTVVNTLLRRNGLVPTGTHRPTTTELVAYVDAEVTGAPFLELSGISRSVSVEFCSTGSNLVGENQREDGEAHQVRSSRGNHLIVVEVPDTLLVPELTSAVSQVLETADLILWTTDSQKYADAAFHRQISAFPRQQNSYFVLTHTEGLTASQQETLNQELAAIAERLGVSSEILQISVYEDSSLARFRETVAEISRAPEARWRSEQAAISHIAMRSCQDLELKMNGESSPLSDSSPSDSASPSTAETKLVDQVAQVSGLVAVQTNFSKRYLQAGGFWTLWPVLNWLAGIKPLASSSENSAITVGETAADEPVDDNSVQSSADSSAEHPSEDSTAAASTDASTSTGEVDGSATPQADSLNRVSTKVNTAGITSAARAYAVAVSTERPSKWINFAQLKAIELSGNLASALTLALESWKIPARPTRTWWRIWRIGHWFWLAALLGGLLWSLIAGVAFLGGAGTSAVGRMVGPAPLPLVIFAVAIVGTLAWSLAGAKMLRRGAQNYGKECADKFSSLILEVTRQAFLVKMNQNLDVYPQLSELFLEMRGEAQSC